MKKIISVNMFILILFWVISVSCMPLKKEVNSEVDIITPTTKIAFDSQTGSLINIEHLNSGQKFIKDKGVRPLFDFTLTRPYENKSINVSASDFHKLKVTRTKPDKVELIFSKHKSMPLNVNVLVSVDNEGLVHFNIVIHKTKEWAISRIKFPQFVSPAQLGEDFEDDRLLATGWSGHVLVEAPGSKTFTLQGLYPQSMNTQFAALYDNTAGLYVATYDTAGHYKRWSVAMDKGKSVEMKLEHLTSEIEVIKFELPYDIVLRTFTGDWHDAADIYKHWAKQQPWCTKKISERKDIPGFFKEGSALLCVPFLHEIPDYKLYPYDYISKLPRIALDYKKQTGLPHIGFAPFGWENRGAWVGINYFPVRPSNEVWQKVSQNLNKQGDFICMLPSGFAWVVKRKDSRSGPSFDDSQQFERCKGMVVHNSDGSPRVIDKYADPKDYNGLSVRLCHSDKSACDTVCNIFLNILKLGTSIVQFDQEHGGSQAMPCYSESHNHPPGYTNQYWTDFRDLCEEILKKGKSIKSEFGLSIESCSELLIPYMSTMWGRQTYEADAFRRGIHSVGVFSYIYHEYIPVLGDGFSLGQGMEGTLGSAELRCFRLANTLVLGLIPTQYMERVPLIPENDWEKTVSRAFFSFCRPYAKFPEYLLMGKIRKPPFIECKDQDLWLFQADKDGEVISDGRKAVKEIIHRQTVIAGSFEAEDGSVGTIIVNTSSNRQHSTIRLNPGNLHHKATLFSADRTEVQKWNKCPGEISVYLEPFGVRMLILSDEHS